MTKQKQRCEKCLKQVSKLVLYRGQNLCRSCYIIANSNIDKINSEDYSKVLQQKLYNKEILKKKKTYRGPSYEYIVRLLTSKNKTGDAYGITIPREIVERYNLFHKKFKVEEKENGKIILYTNIGEIENE